MFMYTYTFRCQFHRNLRVYLTTYEFKLFHLVSNAALERNGRPVNNRELFFKLLYDYIMITVCPMTNNEVNLAMLVEGHVSKMYY